ncbi:hypothetical protein F5148DRAFT_1151690 [Russula earlei]|uniref:Uncharacterized protein n=1 Tax=Russula earlei TaxID=71964 RepID=A0ACC0U1H9_9AGAM|nr:hypothetical protein F5148DRAFT_1151690 [Russula earlei]
MGQKCTWEHAPEPGERPAHRVREDGRRTSEGVDGSGSESDDEGDVTVGENFCEAEDLFDLLRARCSASNYVDFHGTYPVKEDPLISPKQHVMMVAQEVWQLTGYRFIQDEAHKKKAKPSCKPGVKHLDHIRMKRYPCQSHLVITCIQKKAGPLHVMIILQHHMKHVLYLDVSMPSEALKMIEEQVKWLTPSAMASRVQASYPQVTSKQICKAWRELSPSIWQCDKLQLPSARKLLAEYPEEADLFDTILLKLEWMQPASHCHTALYLLQPPLTKESGQMHWLHGQRTKVDLDGYKGGLPIDIVVQPPTTQLAPPVPLRDTVNCIMIKVPAMQWMQAHTPISSTSTNKENAGPGWNTSAGDMIIQGTGFKLHLEPAPLMTTNPGSEEKAINKETSMSKERARQADVPSACQML